MEYGHDSESPPSEAIIPAKNRVLWSLPSHVTRFHPRTDFSHVFPPPMEESSTPACLRQPYPLAVVPSLPATSSLIRRRRDGAPLDFYAPRSRPGPIKSLRGVSEMGLLDKLWDDTLAGPQPDTGLSRLRKHAATFAFRSNTAASKDEAMDLSRGLQVNVDPSPEEEPRVTRSIMIKRPAGCPSPGSGTPPASPAGSTPPVSPFSPGSGGREWNRFRRKSSSVYERGVAGGGGGGTVVGFGPRSAPPPNEV